MARPPHLFSVSREEADGSMREVGYALGASGLSEVIGRSLHYTKLLLRTGLPLRVKRGDDRLVVSRVSDEVLNGK